MLPIASPLVRRSQRTGLAAVATKHGEDLDRVTQRKQHFNELENLGRRFAPGHSAERSWPEHFDPDDPAADQGKLFPFKGDRWIVGIVHADGNGMASILRWLDGYLEQEPSEHALAKALLFSVAVEQATAGAAQEATKHVLEREGTAGGVMPARPIVLGGTTLLQSCAATSP